jgi:glutathione S-transferase
VLERAKLDQLLVFMATEIPQKHNPLMRKLLTAEVVHFNVNKLLTVYKIPDDRLLTDALSPRRYV